MRPMEKLLLGVCAVFMLASCASQAPRSHVPEETVTRVQTPIPPDSPLAEVQQGMGLREITDLIGPPTDTSHYMTGKTFIPFYFGDDHSRIVLHYRGMGRIVLWGGAYSGNPTVMEVEYDPAEPGYFRR